MHQETCGRALELKVGVELPENSDDRSPGKRKKSMKEMITQSSPLFAIEIREALCEITRALKSGAELTQKVSNAPYHAKNQKATEELTEALSHSMGPADSQQGLKNSIKGSAENSKSTESSFVQVHIAYKI